MSVMEGPGRFDELLKITRTISSFQNASFLAASLPELLRSILDFEQVSLQLYDPETNRMTVLPAIPDQALDEDDQDGSSPLEGWPLSWMWTQQKVLIGELSECRSRFSRIAKLSWYQHDGIYCMVPLISSQRCLGGLEIVGVRSQVFSADDMYVIQSVALILAETLDKISSRAAARLAHEKLLKERENDRILVEVTNAVITNLDLHKLLAEVSNSLRTFFGVEFVSMELKLAAAESMEPGRREAWDTQVLHCLGGDDGVEFRDIKAMEEAPLALVVQRKTVLLAGYEELRRMAGNSQFASFLHAHGVQALCALPLISGDNVFGILSLARTQRAGFSPDEVGLLQAVADRIAIAVNNALAYQEISRLKDKLTREKLYLQEEIGETGNFGPIIGQSVALKRVLEQVQLVADSDCTVLIMGETGTGKELVARAIHNLSKRKAHTMVKVNCAAIPAGLFESDLFGHEKGAFTGALSHKQGRFEFANRSTLFLDEIGEVPMDLQPKLLRALQEREIDRIGGTRVIPVDVRVIAATNCDLPQLVREHKYRSDLYYRLSVFPIVIPPLRDRRDDIPALVRHFTQKYSERLNRSIESISAETMKELSRLSWPGNIRELENVIERAVILTRGPVLNIPISELCYCQPYGEARHELPPPARKAIGGMSFSSDGENASNLSNLSRERILQVLFETSGVVGGSQGAAARLGLKRTTLISRMKRLGISARDLEGTHREM